MDKESFSPPPIEDTLADLDDRLNYIKRFYKEKFGIDDYCGDVCVLLHSNKLCIISLAASHPIIRNKLKITNIDFQVTDTVNRLNNKTTGKRKRHAQVIARNSPICFVYCENGSKYIVSSPIAGKLIEINERLQDEPQLLGLHYADNYFQQCYLAIIQPKHDIDEKELTKGLLSLEEYEKTYRGSCISNGYTSPI